MNAVLAAESNDVVDAVARAEAVSTVRGSEDFQAIGTAFKRIKNILRQAGRKEDAGQPRRSRNPTQPRKPNRNSAPSCRTRKRRSPKMERRLSRRLKDVAQLRQPVDVFFDKVMVMVEDRKVRANRLALLRDLLADFSTIADFSEIVMERK